MLSCSCMEYDPEYHKFAWEGGDRWLNYPNKRGKRCCSCQKMIKEGDECLAFNRYRATISEVECNIYGEDGFINLAKWYMCEKCGEIFQNLDDLGFCLSIDDDMNECLEEYKLIQREST